MHEKRISVRTDLLGVEAKVSDDGDNWLTVSARDISDSGLGFVADKEFPPGSQLKFEGSVSDHVKTLELVCDMRVIFSGTTPEGKFLYGSRFFNMTKEQKMGLSVFIEMMVTKFPPLLQ